MTQKVVSKLPRRDRRRAQYEIARVIHGASSPHWSPRTCFAHPIPTFETAIELLSSTADAILSGEFEIAKKLVREAEMPELISQAMSVMSTLALPGIVRWRPIDEASLPPYGRVDSGYFSKPMLNCMYKRDGWRCRFCGCRVVRPEARAKMQEYLPGVIRWTAAYGDHAGFFVLSGSPDHVQQHAWSGPSTLDNLVTACQICQYGRGEYFIEEVGLIDPRIQEPFAANGWDGLERLLSLPTKKSAEPTKLVEINMKVWSIYQALIKLPTPKE